MTHGGYDRALLLAYDALSKREPLDIVANTGVVWDGAGYAVPWYGELRPLASGGADEQIIWLHYMLGQGPKAPRGRYIAYKQVPGAAIYDGNFAKRCIDPMVKTFKDDLTGFAACGEIIGGRAASLGDASFTVDMLPYIPLTFVLWQGDDEVPSNGNILFDETAIEWLCPEDLVVLAGLPVYKMIGMARSKAGGDGDHT